MPMKIGKHSIIRIANTILIYSRRIWRRFIFIVIILLACFGLWPMSLIGIKNLPKYKNMCIKLILLVRIRFTTRRMEALIIREVRLLLQIFIIPDLMAIR